MNSPTQMTNPVRVCSFESRRAEEIQRLIERHGGVATVAPSMREIPIEQNTQAIDFALALFNGQFDVVVFMTGVGARALFEAIEHQYDRADLVEALNRCITIVRGPKPTAVLREWRIDIDFRAPEPNTWRELLSVIDAELELSGKTVAVQEYGESNQHFYDELQNRGATVRAVPVYRWGLPEEIEPLRDAIRRTLADEFDTLIFTSANQVTNVMTVAQQEGCQEEFLAAANRCVIGSIGPTASEKLRESGLPPDFEASPPKMGVLVREAVEQTPRRLSSKRSH